MRIEHDGGNAARCDDPGKLREEQHGAFNMHMAVDEAGSKPASLQVALLVAMIALSQSAYSNDEAIGDGDISGITFAATDIHKPGITQHEVSREEATRNLDAALKSVHKIYPP